MMSTIHTVAFYGIKTLAIEVQVQILSGKPSFNIVGLPDKAVGESRERIRGALHSLGLSLPAKRITVNLAPADVQKEGSHYDLAIAIALLRAMEVLPAHDYQEYVALGELSLDGRILKVNGALPAAFYASANRMQFICPEACGPEAAWVGNNVAILAPANLLELIQHFRGEHLLPQPGLPLAVPSTSRPTIDIADVKGQEMAKRALEVAAAGGHNMLMTGTPGTGKSMLANCLSGLLPPLDTQGALEVSMVHSIAGTLPPGEIIKYPVFRAPHHSASMPALVGGGAKARPGEISLAHLGVLFLDELPEFSAQALEALRQPLENRKITVSRANHNIDYPANVQIVAAMNPCRCGYLFDARKACPRAPVCGNTYQNRLSGPFLDRMDINIVVPDVDITQLLTMEKGKENSEVVGGRVAAARAIQAERYRNYYPIKTNAQADAKALEQIAPLSEAAQQFLIKAAEKFELSARGYHRIIKVAMTICDLESIQRGAPQPVQPHHVAEALNYRRINSNYS